MKVKCLGFFFLALSTWLSAQSIQLSLPQVTVNDGEIVTVPLTVTDFDSIVSLQLSINFNTDVATFVEYSVGVLPLLAIGDFQADQGELRLSWFDNTGNGRSLADGEVIANLTFTAMGAPGDFTPLIFTNEPLAIQIFKATETPGVFAPVNLIPDEGSISIAAPLGFMIDVQDVSCSGFADGTVAITLGVNPEDYTIDWLGPDGFTASTFDLANLSGGDYSLVIRDMGGDEVFNYDFTLAEAEMPLTITQLETTETDCNIANGSLSAVAVGGEEPYQYMLGGLISTSGQFSDLLAGDYDLQLIDAYGCIINEEITIISPDAPLIDLADSLQLCNGPEVLMPEAIGDYLWSTGDESDTLLVETSGVYGLTVTNAQGCISTASINIQESSPPVAMLETDFPELCPTDTLQLLVSGGSTYRWLDNIDFLSADTIANPLVFPDSTRLFSVKVGNDCGFDTLSFNVDVYEILASAGPDTCIGPGTELELQARGGLFYEWVKNTESLSVFDIPNPVASPEDSTTYQVMITDINGCVTLDDVTVLVANDPAQSIIPYNLISPNGDGKNDVLDFDEIGKFGENSLKIYNRWGDLVYQKRNYQEDEERFDGTFNGKVLPAGNYFYILAFKQNSINQTLTIIRE